MKSDFVINHYDVVAKIRSYYVKEDRVYLSFENGTTVEIENEVDLSALQNAISKQHELFAIRKANRLVKSGWKTEWSPEYDETEPCLIDQFIPPTTEEEVEEFESRIRHLLTFGEGYKIFV